jgi:hypothetical protein
MVEDLAPQSGGEGSSFEFRNLGCLLGFTSYARHPSRLGF